MNRKINTIGIILILMINLVCAQNSSDNLTNSSVDMSLAEVNNLTTNGDVALK